MKTPKILYCFAVVAIGGCSLSSPSFDVLNSPIEKPVKASVAGVHSSYLPLGCIGSFTSRKGKTIRIGVTILSNGWFRLKEHHFIFHFQCADKRTPPLNVHVGDKLIFNSGKSDLVITATNEPKHKVVNLPYIQYALEKDIYFTPIDHQTFLHLIDQKELNFKIMTENDSVDGKFTSREFDKIREMIKKTPIELDMNLRPVLR